MSDSPFNIPLKVIHFPETANDGIFLVGLLQPNQITDYKPMSTSGLIRFAASRHAAREFFYWKGSK